MPRQGSGRAARVRAFGVGSDYPAAIRSPPHWPPARRRLRPWSPRPASPGDCGLAWPWRAWSVVLRPSWPPSSGLVGQYGFTRFVPLEYPPDVLANKAQEMLARFGYGAKPVDTANGLYWNSRGTIAYIERASSRTRIAGHRCGRGARPGIVFWYAHKPAPADCERVPRGGCGERPRRCQTIRSEREPGQHRVWLSTSGRLVQFEAVPPLVEPSLGQRTRGCHRLARPVRRRGPRAWPPSRRPIQPGRPQCGETSGRRGSKA